MFDPGEFAIGNVRIARDLRWRRNGYGKWQHDARHRGDVGRRSAVGNINVIGNINVDGNLADVGRNDIFGNAGDIGADRNVRLRREQYRCIVEPDLNLTCHIEQRHPRRNSVGIL
jgi:hypothetical protein